MSSPEEIKARFISLQGEFKHRWWMRPICWLKGHDKQLTNAYGIIYKQCSRCGKDFYTQEVIQQKQEMNKVFYKGEVGEVSGIRWHTTSEEKKHD